MSLLSARPPPGALGLSRPECGHRYPGGAAGRLPPGARCDCRAHRNVLAAGKGTSMTTRLLIIGGSDAGISAGLRAREVDPSCEVTIVLADGFPNYSICGLPFYLSGEVPHWHWLAQRTAGGIAREGIHLFLDSTDQAIDPAHHLVTILDDAVKYRLLPDDRLGIGQAALSK